MTKAKKHKTGRWWFGAFVLTGLLVYFILWAPFPAQNVPPREVWQVVEQQALKHDLSPAFVFAIATAESSLNPLATTSSSRGIMQMSQSAWQLVTDEPFDAAWNWRTNIEMGTRYLAYCKRFLERHQAFSYARLAACYHLGPGEVQDCRWQMSCLPVPENDIYRKLYAGDAQPVTIKGVKLE